MTMTKKLNPNPLDFFGMRENPSSEDIRDKIDNKEILTKQNKTKTKGSLIPAKLKNFSELQTRFKASTQLLNNIDNLGYKLPTQIQSLAIPSLLFKRDFLGISNTGTGKTAAFLIPIIIWLETRNSKKQRKGKNPLALVLVPTRELAKQIYSEALKLSKGCGSIVIKMLQDYVKGKKQI